MTFSGTNINYFKIILPNEYRIEEFQNEIVYESLIYTKSNYEDISRKLLNDKIAINKLIGNNGVIREDEMK